MKYIELCFKPKNWGCAYLNILTAKASQIRFELEGIYVHFGWWKWRRVVYLHYDWVHQINQIECVRSKYFPRMTRLWMDETNLCETCIHRNQADGWCHNCIRNTQEEVPPHE